jgi:hypothetical protein
VVDLADLIELFLDLRVSGEASARLLDLIRGFEQERLDLTFGKAAVEIEEGAVLGAGGVAVAVGLATFHEALDQGGMENFWGELKGAQEAGLALAQGESGGAGEKVYLAHIYM